MIELRIYDGNGVRQDGNWLTDNYGAVIVSEFGSDYTIVELRENTGGSAALVVTCLDELCQGIPDELVLFGWPDGQDHGSTNQDGVVGFGMGPGAYYRPTTRGPHYVSTGGIRVDGLGMKFGTNHHHLDVMLIQAVPDPEPPPEPPPEPEPEPEPEPPPEPPPTPPVDNVWMTLFEKLDRIIDHLEVLCVASSCNQSVGGVTFESWKPEANVSTVTVHQPGRLTRILSGSSSDTEGADLS